ncbi:MAG: hypothetical protein C0466_15975, partial [Candidatus Accumulibacter sp.]|nr:hypothetical protein [Accumulibacter sp.]
SAVTMPRNTHLMVGRLEAVGLVSDQGRRENDGLTLTLPLSPIGSAPAVAAPTTAARQASKSTESAIEPMTEAPSDVRGGAESMTEVIQDDWGDEPPEIQSGTELFEGEPSLLPGSTVQSFVGDQDQGDLRTQEEPAPEVEFDDWDEDPPEGQGDAEVAGRAPEKDAGSLSDGVEDAGSTPARLPDERRDEIPESPSSAMVFEVNDEFPLLLAPVIKKTFVEAKPRAGDTPAPCPPQASIPTPTPSEKAPEAVRASLTLADIRSRLAAAGFIYLKTPDSKTLMQGWVTREVPMEMLEKVIAEVARDNRKQPTPTELDRCLRERTAECKGRGKVAL